MIKVSISGVNSKSRIHDDCNITFIEDKDPNVIVVEASEHIYDSTHGSYDDNKIKVAVSKSELIDVMKKFLN